MEIGQRLRKLRVFKRLSQGDIEHRTGLLRCYVSRVENGYTVPNVETLEKFARALEIPLYRVFTDYEVAEKLNVLVKTQSESKHRHELRLFAKAFKRMDDRKRNLLLSLAQQMARRRSKV
jgi:transcriptional regulator with XRE-family HTH domain